MKQLSQETRSETIFRHTHRMLHELRISMGTFGLDVVGEYNERTEESARTVVFKSGGDPFRCQATNAQRLARYMDPEAETRMPVDLEEAWVAALHEPFRSQCLADLSQRYGSLYVPMPSAAGITDMESVGQVTREFARALTEISPTMADQVIDEKDAPYIPAVVSALDALIGSATSLRARYVKQSGIADPVLWQP